jgi:hypothetical protein
VSTPKPHAPVNPPATSHARFLVDEPMQAFSSVRVESCAAGGRSFARSLVLSVPTSDPAVGGYARVDYTVPSGIHTLTAAVGLVDGSLRSTSVGVHLFVESPKGGFVLNTTVTPSGNAPITVPVEPGQRLRIQASASAARQVCFGSPQLRP